MMSKNVCVSEVELIEPTLYLAVNDPVRAMFADAVERELHTLCKGAHAPMRHP
jgi:hypothetical protein